MVKRRKSKEFEPIKFWDRDKWIEELEDEIIGNARKLKSLHKHVAPFLKFLEEDITRSEKQKESFKKEVGLKVKALWDVEKKTRQTPMFVLREYLNPMVELAKEIRENFDCLDWDSRYFRQKHHPEFEEEYKRKAKKFLAEGLSLNEISLKLGPSVSTLQSWLGLV